MKGWGQRPKEVLLGILSAFKKTCWRILKSSSKGTTEEPKWLLLPYHDSSELPRERCLVASEICV